MNFLVTDRVRLTEICPSDKPALIENLNERSIYEVTLRIPFPYTEADADAWLAVYEENLKQHGQPVNWAIRDSDDRLIGGIGFQGLSIGKSHRAEIGYWLAKPYWGRGVMTTVVRNVCAFAFNKWGLVKIEAHVFAGNPASARVLEKCGFVQEGFLRKHFFKDGRFLDVRLFALVKE